MGNPFWRNIGILAGGTVFAQALMALALPVLTRVYSPEDFSLLAVYMGLLGIFTVVSCLRLNIAIPLPERDEDALNLTTLSLMAVVMFCLLLAGAVVFIPDIIISYLKQPNLRPYLWMIPAGVFVAAGYNALQYWATRKRRFGLVTRTRVTRAVGGIGTQLGFGVASPSPFGLLFGHFVYSGLGIIALLRSMWRFDRALFTSINRGALLRNLGIYRRFPLYSVPESLLNVAGIQVPILIIAAASAGPDAGFIMLAMRVMGLPMGLVGSSVAQVYLVDAPDKHRKGNLREFTLDTMQALFKVSVVPFIVVGGLSPFLFPLVFGEEWTRAGVIVAWMTPWFILQFVASPMSMILPVTGQLRTAVLLQGFGFFLRVGSILAIMSVNAPYLAEVYAISGAVFYGVYVMVILAVLRKEAGAQ